MKLSEKKMYELQIKNLNETIKKLEKSKSELENELLWSSVTSLQDLGR